MRLLCDRMLSARFTAAFANLATLPLNTAGQLSLPVIAVSVRPPRVDTR